MTKRKNLILSLTVLISLLLSIAFAAGGYSAAEAAAVAVSLDAPSQVARGSEFSVDVNIGSVTAFDGGQFDVSFTSSIMQLEGVEAGVIGTTQIPVSVWNMLDSDTCRVIVNVPGVPGVNGSGSLAVLRFHASDSQAGSGALTLSNGFLNNNLGTEIPATWAGDSVTVREDLLIGTTALPSGTVGSPYSYALSAAGGNGSLSWLISSGSMPSGLSLSSAGVISGTPTSPGQSTFTVSVTDGQLSASRALTISVIPESTDSAPNGWYEYYATGANASGAVCGSSWLSQSFTPATSHYLNTVSLHLYKVGSPTYTVYLRLYAAGTDDKPTGSVLARTSFPASTLTTSARWCQFQFPTGYKVTAGKKYALVISAAAGTSGNMVYWPLNTAGAYTRGMRATSTSQGYTWTTNSKHDFMFAEGQNLAKWCEQNTVSNTASGVTSGSWQSQSFTPVTSHYLNAVSLCLYKIGSPNYTVSISLYLAGSDNKPTGSALRTTTFGSTSLTTTATWHEFKFSNAYYVTAGTRYALVVSATSGASGNLVCWRVNTSGTYSRGMKATSANHGASWASYSAQDFAFKEGTS